MDLYRRTGDILLVKEALHHRSITSTLVYAKHDAERLRRAMSEEEGTLDPQNHVEATVRLLRLCQDDRRSV